MSIHSPCSCCPDDQTAEHYQNLTLNKESSQDITIRTSVFIVRWKEIFILLLFFLLLLYSLIAFLRNWQKNYGDINHLPYYSICLPETPAMAEVIIQPWEEKEGVSRTGSTLSRIVGVRWNTFCAGVTSTSHL